MRAVQDPPLDSAATAGAYDCFVSYARADTALAQAVRKGLAGMAKPWYRRRALRVFLDTASLSASSDLPASIVAALERSRFLVFLASDESADRPWVDREVAWWREHRDPRTVLIADCGANLRWDDEAADFAPDAQLPPSLRGWFPAEPTWTDLSWAKTHPEPLTLRNRRFGDHVADLAAPLRGMSKDALVGEDLRQHRRSLRLAWAAAGALLVLAVAATLAAIIAVTQRHQAIVQRDRARARALAALAEASRTSDPLTSLRDATGSLAIDATPEGVRALRGTLALPLRRVINVNERVDGLEFSPDGRSLAQSARGGVHVWDLGVPRPATPAARGPAFVTDFSFDGSGRRLASVGQLGHANALQITDLAHPSPPRTIRYGDLSDGAISPDGTTVALATQSGILALRDLATGRTVVRDRHAGSVHGLRFGPDGRHLLAFTGRGAKIWSTGPAGASVTLGAPGLLDARITPANTVVGVAAGGAVTTWSLGGRLLRRTHIGLGPTEALTLSPDGRLLAVVTGAAVDVWDLRSGGRRRIGTHPGGAITALAFGPGDHSLASAAEGDTLIRIWDLRTGPPAPARGHGFYASILTAAPGGRLLAGTEDFDSAVAVWPADGGTRRVFHGGGEGILAAGFLPDGRRLLTVSDDGRARFVDAVTGRRQVVRSGLGPADVAAISPDRRHVAVAADGRPLRVWDLTGGPPVTLAPRTHGLDQLRFGAGGRIAGADDTRHVEVWSTSRAPPVRLTAPERIDFLDFAPDARSLAAGSGEAGGGVFRWSRIDPRARPVLLGRHPHFVSAVAVSPDGSGVASAGDIGPVYLWPLDGGPGITLAEGTKQATTGLAYDPTGRTLATSDGTLRLLACAACGPPARLVSEARELVRGGGVAPP